ADGTCTSVVNAATSDFTYDSTIRLMNAPKVLVYSSDISDPVTQVLERAGIMRYTDWDFIDADGGYPRTVDINADGTSVTYNSLAEVLEGHDWVHLHHEDFTSSTQGKNNAVAIGNFVTGGGYMYCQCLAAETLDQALEQMGLTTMAFTNPIAGRTLTQSGYWDTLDSELTTDIDFYLQDASGAPLYYFPLDQNYYGFGFSPTGAVDLNDNVQGFSGAFKTMNPEFIDETKNLTITGWYDPAVAETSIWNEAGWQSANLILYESKLSVKLNADGDKNDNMTIETLYNNRVAYGWDGYIERQAVETWEDTHTEVQTTTTVIGHVCSYKKKVGGKWTYCANKSCCNNAAHAAYWTSNVYQTQTVTVPGQWVVDYYQYRRDLNKDGDYTDAQNNAETYVRELCGLHGDGFFTYTTGHEPSDLAMDRLILNNLLLSGAAGRMNYFGAADLDGTDPEKGAVFYRNNAWFGFFDSQNDEHRFLDKGDILLAEPGNMCGTTNKAVMYRYKTDLDKDLAYYEHQQGSGRVVLVPIVECVSASYTSMYAMDSKTSDDDRRLRVIGSAYFFLRDVVHEAALRSDLGPVKPGQVRGIFIGYALKPS
ncbi:MAG TPA: hypothetical protein PKM88_06750, partial [bacterium]|nr:hypothetical protein [bacterium]